MTATSMADPTPPRGTTPVVQLLTLTRQWLADDKLNPHGVLRSFIDDGHDAASRLAYAAVVKLCSPWNLSGWAVRHTRDELVALFDRAIAEEESRG